MTSVRFIYLPDAIDTLLSASCAPIYHVYLSVCVYAVVAILSHIYKYKCVFHRSNMTVNQSYFKDLLLTFDSAHMAKIRGSCQYTRPYA